MSTHPCEVVDGQCVRNGCTGNLLRQLRDFGLVLRFRGWPAGFSVISGDLMRLAYHRNMQVAIERHAVRIGQILS